MAKVIAKLPTGREERKAALRALYEHADPDKSNTQVKEEMAEKTGISIRAIARMIADHGWQRTVNPDAQKSGRKGRKGSPVPKAPKKNGPQKKTVVPTVEAVKNHGGKGTPARAWEWVSDSDKITFVDIIAQDYLNTGERTQALCNKHGVPQYWFRIWTTKHLACREIWEQAEATRAFWAVKDGIKRAIEMFSRYISRLETPEPTITEEFIETGIKDDGTPAGYWKCVRRVTPPAPMPDPFAFEKWLNILRLYRAELESIQQVTIGGSGNAIDDIRATRNQIEAVRAEAAKHGIEL